LKNELHNIISGKGTVRFGTIIQPIASYLNNSTPTGSEPENAKQRREQETKRLEEYVFQNNLWITDIDFSQYVSEGAEQKVYLKDADHVIKLNDAIYYSSWRDYFYNLLLHNFFFPDTAYDLKGFTREDNILYAVVQQSYVSVTGHTNLNQVKLFLAANSSKTSETTTIKTRTLELYWKIYTTKMS